MTAKASADARLQTALVALRDALIPIAPWMTQGGTTRTRGVLRMTIVLEPVYEPLVLERVVALLETHAIAPRSVRARPGIDLRMVHTPSAVELDLGLRAELSRTTQKYLDKTLGRGWQRRRPGGPDRP